ncbi:MAG: F0F1 ATP synthase subunit gamma, partial [Candidatus Methanomethylophilus sp.]|nr:F0F1 ATP synthase subunit gamma [Methanomethylophilus sp.]
TLAAMRTACDNARDSAAELETEISRKRQSEVTSGVLETSGSGARRGDSGRGGSQ